MKEIIINEHNLEDKDIDSVVRRAKLNFLKGMRKEYKVKERN